MIKNSYYALKTLLKSWLIKLFNSHSYRAIANGFLLVLPLIMIGTVAELIAYSSSPHYQRWMLSLFGSEWQSLFHFIIESSYIISPFLLVLTVSFSLANAFSSNKVRGDGYHYKAFIASLLSLSIFLLFSTNLQDGFFYMTGGRQESLMSIVIGLVTTRVFYMISSSVIVSYQFYSDTQSDITRKIFKDLLASLLTLLLAVMVRIFLLMLNINVGAIVSGYLGKFFINQAELNLLEAVHYAAIQNLLHFLSLSSHGYFSSVRTDFFYHASNTTIYNEQFFRIFLGQDGNATIIAFLIGVLIYRSGHKLASTSVKKVKILMIPSVFNIHDMTLYGFPLVLNPLFIIPFIVAPIVNLLITVLFFKLGLLAMPVYEVGKEMPIFLSGYLSSGSWSTVFVQFFNVAIATLIYYPFIILYDRVADGSFRLSQSELVKTGYTQFLQQDHYFTKQSGDMASVARILCGELKVAFYKRELYLEYQPKVLFREQKIFGFEALIRWHHRDYGFIPPPVIIALAEEGDFLFDVSVWISEVAAKQLKNWHDLGYKELTMAINLSSKELQNSATVKKVSRIVQKHALTKQSFEVEITENMKLEASSNVQKNIAIFSEAKIPLAIDDFGMGLSSALYLTRFDINTLKIDHSISINILKDSYLQAILSSIISMCQQLEIMVVVEFVDNHEQLTYLVEQGCNIFQGYLFSKPLNAYDATLYIEQTHAEGRLIYD